MRKKRNESLLKATVVRLVFVTALFLLCVFCTVVSNTEELERFFGVHRNGKNCEAFKNGKSSVKNRINKASYKKYSIDHLKASQLDRMLQHIMTYHPRPADDHFGYNVTRSDEIPVSRDVRDSRPAVCRSRNFNYSSFPTVSVVSPFYNEALTPLVRHVHALLTRTSHHLLVDILLIDDHSTLSYLGKDLEKYFSHLDPRIRLLRNEERKGLIWSRLRGADVARGEVLVFLDAHMEVNHGWLEPLLERLVDEEELLVQSDITPILTDTFDLDTGLPIEYRGGFGWDLSYMWFPLPPYLHQFQKSDWDPIPFPVIQGGSVAVRKAYFDSIGRFDAGLSIWGGEHFEISFNVWMTGGRVEIVPCSKVGHIFKDTKYSFGSQEKNYVVAKNNIRVSEIWMDEYVHFTRSSLKAKQFPEPVFTEAEWRSIEDRRKLRQRRHSKSFSWYLRHVLPDQPVPSADDMLFGQIGSMLTRDCVYVTDSGFLSMTSSCMEFKVTVKENTFSIDRWHRMRHADKCVGVDEDTRFLKLVQCPCIVGDHATSYWSSNYEGNLIYHSNFGPLCATLVHSSQNGQDVIQLQKCVNRLAEQAWSFMYNLWK